MKIAQSFPGQTLSRRRKQPPRPSQDLSGSCPQLGPFRAAGDRGPEYRHSRGHSAGNAGSEDACCQGRTPGHPADDAFRPGPPRHPACNRSRQKRQDRHRPHQAGLHPDRRRSPPNHQVSQRRHQPAAHPRPACRYQRQHARCARSGTSGQQDLPRPDAHQAGRQVSRQGLPAAL